MKRQFLLCALLFNISSQCADNESNPLPTPLDPQSKELAITYKAIQYIHELAAKIAQEAKENDQISLLKLEKIKIGRGSQTEQGLYLCVCSYPDSLYTPWGTVKIYGNAASNESPLSTIFEKFRKHLKLEFVENVAERACYDNVWKEMHFFLDTIPNEITKKELDKYRGSDRLIMADFAGYPSIYKILAIGDTVLPEPKKLIKGTRRKNKEVTKNWEIMMEQCKQAEGLVSK